MRRLNGRDLGIDRGSLILFSDFEDGGPMWTATGPREVRKRVIFSSAFLEPPVVSVSFSLWDMHHATNARADLSAEKISEEGFEMVFRTWGDTRIARMRADWTAFGAIMHSDNWDVD